ncbi:YopX family protein [Niallia alba]|uniref:YopX family protein n=1 Tax=Niallia alba TaxID=2729105 RepID=UPI002E22C41B|nr:YopX family protein [Niallia alba]
MRDLKFRVWEPLNKELHYLDFALYKFTSGRNSHKFVLPPDRQSLQNPYTIMNLESVKVMQYTGLSDSNNVDIYEGDIVTARKSSNTGSFTGYVHYLNGCYWVNFIGHESYYTELIDLYNAEYEPIKVIGNIHENPELMNG